MMPLSRRCESGVTFVGRRRRELLALLQQQMFFLTTIYVCIFWGLRPRQCTVIGSKAGG